MVNADENSRQQFDRLAHQFCGLLISAVVGSLMLIGLGVQSPKDALGVIASMAIGAVLYLVGWLIYGYRIRRREPKACGDAEEHV